VAPPRPISDDGEVVTVSWFLALFVAALGGPAVAWLWWDNHRRARDARAAGQEALRLRAEQAAAGALAEATALRQHAARGDCPFCLPHQAHGDSSRDTRAGSL
jgi:hypothetical protein